MIGQIALCPAMRKDGVSHDIVDGLPEGGLAQQDVDACFWVCVHPDGVHASLNVLFGDLSNL